MITPYTVQQPYSAPMLYKRGVQPCCEVMLRVLCPSTSHFCSTSVPGGWCLPQLAQVALEPADVSVGNCILDFIHCSALGTICFGQHLAVITAASGRYLHSAKIGTYLCCFSSDLLAMNTLARLHKQTISTNMLGAACISHTQAPTWLLMPCMFQSPGQPAAMQLYCSEVRLLPQTSPRSQWFDNEAHIASSDQKSLALLAGHGFRPESCRPDSS